MSDIQKDKDALNKHFAENAISIEDMEQGNPEKFNEGYVAGDKPMAKHENYMKQWFSLGLRYLNQKGIPEWDDTTQYIAGKSFVQHNGLIYKARSTHTNQEPPDNSGNNYWRNEIDFFIQTYLGTKATSIGSTSRYLTSSYVNRTFTKTIVCDESQNTTLNFSLAKGFVMFDEEDYVRLTFDNHTLRPQGQPVKLGAKDLGLDKKFAEINAIVTHSGQVNTRALFGETDSIYFKGAESSLSHEIHFFQDSDEDLFIKGRGLNHTTANFHIGTAKDDETITSIVTKSITSENTLRDVTKFNNIESVSLDILKSDGVDQSLASKYITTEDIYEQNEVQVPILDSAGNQVELDGEPQFKTIIQKGDLIETKTFINESKMKDDIIFTLMQKVKELEAKVG